MTQRPLLSLTLAVLGFGASTAQSQILFNELVASNSTGIQDEALQYEDWLELINTSSAAVDVSGWYLTDKLLRPTKWPIPANTVIPAGGRLLIWCDEDQQDGPMHSNFKLSATAGEELWLYKPDGITIVDNIKFGPQATDVSFGRLFDGRVTDYWVTYVRPTPRQLNDPGTCGSRQFSSANPNRHPIALDLVGSTQINQSFNLTLQNGVANSAFVLFFAVAPAPVEIPLNARFGVLINVPFLTLVLPSNGAGQAALPLTVPNDPTLDKVRLYFQAGGFDANGLFGSNALEAILCK